MYRSIPYLNDPALVVEELGVKNETLGNSIVDFGTFYPKKAVSSVAGIRWKLDVTLTSGSSTALSGNLSAIINSIKITQGTKTRLKADSFDQFNRVYNMITGLTLSDITLNQAVSTTATYTLKTPIMPFHWTVDTLPYFDMRLNPLSSITGTPDSGSASLTVEYFYAEHGDNDQFAIQTAPSSLAVNTDIDISSILTIPSAVEEMFIDVSTDSNLNYSKFSYGKTALTDDLSADELKQFATPYSFYTHIDGFLPLPVKYGTQFTSGVKAEAPVLVINVATALTPTFYIKELV